MDGGTLMAAATKLPTEMGPIHFVGIGGIGMSGIAEVLLNHGYRVQGSDLTALARSPSGSRGSAPASSSGQDAANLEGAAVVVISSAIKRGNPELDAARALGLPVVRRAEMLAELMRLKSNVAVAGTHGKTTTTTMVATLLDAGGLDPTVINGGIIHAYGSNARAGQGEWMVVEADESDGTFNRLPATIAMVTNIDPEHMEHWGTPREPAPGLHRLRVEHPVLRPRRVLHRPPRGAGAGRPDHRPPRRDLRLQRPGRRARRSTCATRRAWRISTSRCRPRTR